MSSSVALQKGLALPTISEVGCDGQCSHKEHCIRRTWKEKDPENKYSEGAYVDIFLWFNNKCFTVLNSVYVPNINDLPTNSTKLMQHTDLGEEIYSL